MLMAAWPTSRLVSSPKTQKLPPNTSVKLPAPPNPSLPGLLVLQSAECVSSSLGLLGTVQPPRILPAPSYRPAQGLQRETDQPQEMVGSVELPHRPAARPPSAQGQAWRLHQGRRAEGNLAQRRCFSVSPGGTEARGARTPFLSRSAVPTLLLPLPQFTLPAFGFSRGAKRLLTGSASAFLSPRTSTPHPSTSPDNSSLTGVAPPLSRASPLLLTGPSFHFHSKFCSHTASWQSPGSTAHPQL